MRIAREVLIFFLVSLVFIYIVSIFTYSPFSSNSLLSHSAPIGTSLLGSFGAYIASISFFLIGKASYFLAVPLLFLIITIIFQKKDWLKSIKWICFLVITLSGFYGLYSNEAQVIQGGLIGNLSGNVLKNLFGVIGTTLILFIANGFILSRLFPNFTDKVHQKLNFKINEKKNKDFIPQTEPQAEENIVPNEPQAIGYKVLDLDEDNKSLEVKLVIETTNTHTEVTNISKDEDEIQTFKISTPSENKEPLKQFEKSEIDDNLQKQIINTVEQYSTNDIEHPNISISPILMEDMFKNSQTKETKPLDENVNIHTDINTEKTNANHYKFMRDHYEFPPMNLLKNGDTHSHEDKEKIKETGNKLIGILNDFNIDANMSNIITGPVVTRYEVIPPKGLKINKIVNLMDNIALGIAAYDKIRIEAPIPGKSAVGIEVPNENRQTICLRDLISLTKFDPTQMAIPFALGKGISGKPYFTDISKIPHLLIAGSTGSGKSVCVNSLICSILFSKTPDEVKLLLIDPKRVELKMYEDMPHLLTPVIKEPLEAIAALNWAVEHMEERYKIIENYNVRNIASYNAVRKSENKSTLPYMVIIIDEFADFMMIGGKEMETPIIRLAAMARAVGIHIVLATQRPSADVITGLIKANFPGRIAFKVASKMESRIILDINGAESLLGKGDMLYASPNMSNIMRIQSPFISDEEAYKVTEFFRSKYKPNYNDEILEAATSSVSEDSHDPNEEPLFNEAVQIVVNENKASASYLQRRLKIGYNRAARIVEIMEDMGIVGPSMGSKAREVLVDSWE